MVSSSVSWSTFLQSAAVSSEMVRAKAGLTSSAFRRVVGKVA